MAAGRDAQQRLVRRHFGRIPAYPLRSGFRSDFSGAVGCHPWCHHHLRLCSQESVVNSLYTYLFLAALLFSLGIFGVFQRRSLIGMLIAIELMLNGASINFMAFNRFLAPDPIVGQIYTLFI
ncbi:MAG: NADH-quinone oxidoreductase subunit K, partial [Proteobacteria bacterium]|nr:NADH-quinone oxidoreductase subunit K [Pseudomonadota bacterium]